MLGVSCQYVSSRESACTVLPHPPKTDILNHRFREEENKMAINYYLNFNLLLDVGIPRFNVKEDWEIMLQKGRGIS